MKQNAERNSVALKITEISPAVLPGECMKQMEQMFFLAASRRKENGKDAEKQSEQKENA
ncbi:MAG: hypothetical protein ACLSTV_06190 [Coriobacteriales bacterium]